MTEVALRDGTPATLIEKYPALDPNGDAMELITANVGDVGDGLSFGDLDRLTVPAGGGTSWTIPDLEEGEITIKSLDGVIVIWETNRAYWLSDDVTGEAPDCASRNGKVPEPGGFFALDGENAEINPEGTCASCPMNQFGSASKGQGKACKESKLLYMLREGELLPSIVSLPPTSIKALKSFLIQLAAKKRRKFYEVEVRLDLVSDVSAAGQKYSKVVPKLIRLLEGEERAMAAAASATFTEMLRRAPVAAVVAAADGPVVDADIVEDEAVTVS